MLRQSLKKIYYTSRFKTRLPGTSPPKFHRLLLMYHGISGKDLSAVNGRHLPAKQFEKHLLYFKKHFEVVSLEEIKEKKAAGSRKSARLSIALTFDDGFENNFQYALPLLEKHKLPATFFIPTIALEKNSLLPSDVIDIVRGGTKEKQIHFAGKVFIKKGKHQLLERSSGEPIYTLLHRLPPAQVQEYLSELRTRYHFPSLLEKCDPEAWRLMDAQQVKELSASAFAEIGSHGHSHCALSACSQQELETELLVPKNKLEELTGKNVSSIAYPYGAYNGEVLAESVKAGYTSLLAGGAVKAGEQALPRVGIAGGGTFEQNMLLVHQAFDRFGF